MSRLDTQAAIESARTVLGVELGSTRIKAMLIGEDHTPIASGSHDWENRYDNGLWTYRPEDVWTGLQKSYRKLSKGVFQTYQTPLQTIGAIGFSAMMHGYMAVDKDGNLLVPFRTWRNTTIAQAATGLTELFQFNVPPSVEHCPPLSGDLEQGTPCQRYHLSEHPVRLCPLETDRPKGVRHRRRVGHVPVGILINADRSFRQKTPRKRR